MNDHEREQLIQRLEARVHNGAAPAAIADRYLHGVLQRMVSAGACRFGVCADKPDEAGFSACTLAPPLARMIDHTALKPETTEDQVRTLCEEARQYCFASVCINPCYVSLAARLLQGTPVAVCTVIGFPLGAAHSAVKAQEAAQAIRDGATEVDMVLNSGKLKSGRYEEVEDDIRAVVSGARAVRGAKPVVVKVILEPALLNDEE
jgi:deoxyribose-phosphate aldolase